MATGKAPDILAADFETTTKKEDCRVWAYGFAFIDKPSESTVGNNLLEFIQKIAALGNTTVYFHNLKFDGTFIVDWLLKHRYQYNDDRRLLPMEFSTLYSRMGKLYSITVCWDRGKTTEFRDSAKKLPMKLDEVAKAFKLGTAKGEIDYHADRPIGHEITVDEYYYIHTDVYILAEALRITHGDGMTRLTVGADSLAEYKKSIGTRRFRQLFPIVDDETDAEIRLAYRGGYTYADKRHRGRKINSPGVALDVNSLYPFVMRERELPYGEPIRFDGEPTSDGLWTAEVTFTAKIKPDRLPIIQVKKSSRFHESEYLEVVDEPTTITITNIDWQMYNDHYDIDVIEWRGGHEYTKTRGLFDDYIDKWMKVKAETTGGARALAKLRLNSLYGKFATSRDVTGKAPEIRDDRVIWALEDDSERDPVYTAMGVFITAYARQVTITAAQANYDTFAYADTDSLHLLRDDVPETITVHSTELGAWDHEYSFTEAFYMRAKAYAERKTDGDMVVRIAGLPVNISKKLTFEDFYDGNVIHGKLVPRNVPGGVVLVDAPYELKM